MSQVSIFESFSRKVSPMKISIIIYLFFSAITGTFSEWHKFKTQFGKHYISTVEEKYRQKIYLENKRMIENHNEKYRSGDVSFELGMNQFGDMSEDEFGETMFNGLLTSTFSRSQFPARSISYTKNSPNQNVVVPNEVDWRTRGGVTPVKFQGKECGSCWAFSATGALEGHYFRKTGKLVSLSEQNLVDCSSYYGNQGCNGGIMDWAFQYVIINGGLDTEESYPYEGIDSRPCRYSMKSIGATAESYVDLPEGDEEEMKAAVAIVGPVSVGIHAYMSSFRFYKSGVYYEAQCNATRINHGVLVIGYNTSERGEDYWLVKNSWGTSWGDSGYIKMARNMDNNCGIVSMASYPLIDMDFDKFVRSNKSHE